jgi:hypothetical protein
LPLPVAPVLVPVVVPAPMVLEPDEPRPEVVPELVEPWPATPEEPERPEEVELPGHFRVLLPERPELLPPELLTLPALPLGEVAEPEEPPTVPVEPCEPVPSEPDEPALPEPAEPLPELPVCAKPAPAIAMAATETVAKRSFLMIAFPW